MANDRLSADDFTLVLDILPGFPLLLFRVQKSTEDLWLPAPFAFYLFLLRSDWFMFPVNLSER